MVLYVAPLSSGDKGLWLSVASLPVPHFGAVPGEMATEHSILLPSPGGPSLARICVERYDPAPGAGLIAVDDLTIDATWTAVSQPPSWSTHEAACPAPVAPRGPPA